MPLEIGLYSNLLMAAFFGLGCFLGIHSAILLVEAWTLHCLRLIPLFCR